MNTTEHLLNKVSEECAEVIQRVSKALRFGLNEVQPNQPFNNADRIREEYAGLIAAYDRLVAEGLLTNPDSIQIQSASDKQAKYFEYSKQCGTVE